MNPLIEYPLGHVPPHGAAAAEVEDDVFKEDNVGPDVGVVFGEIEDDEIEEDNGGNGVDEVEEVNVENVGPDVGVVFAQMEENEVENVGPEMGPEFAEVEVQLDGGDNDKGVGSGDTQNVEVGTTERNEDIFEEQVRLMRGPPVVLL